MGSTLPARLPLTFSLIVPTLQMPTQGQAGTWSRLCGFQDHRFLPPSAYLCLTPFDTAVNPHQGPLSSLALGLNCNLKDAQGFYQGLKGFRAVGSFLYCKGLNQPEQGCHNPLDTYKSLSS